MIALITGTVYDVGHHEIMLSVGPMVLELQCPTAGEYAIGQCITLHIYMHWSQDNGPSISGFSDSAQKRVFQLVLSCQGVGARTALALVGQLGVQRFVQACFEQDAHVIAQVSGIGPKRAQQILLHVSSKVVTLAQAGQLETVGHMQRSDFSTIAAALKSLRYNPSEVSAALTYLQKEAQVGGDFQVYMKKALAFLAQHSK